MDAFLSGGEFESPSGNGMKYSYRNFIELYGDKKFIENLGEYEYNIGNDSGLIKSKKKRVIIYTLQN